MDALDALSGALDLLAGSDPFSLSDRASVLRLEKELGRLSCVTSKAVAGFAEGGEWAAAGAQSAAAWIATCCHLPLGEVRAHLRRGRALPSMPVVAEAFSLGSIAPAHVDVLVKAAKAATGTDPQAFTRCEAALVQAAEELGFRAFGDAVTYFTQMADPDGAEEADLARRARRDAYVVESINGMYLLGANLDPVSGAIVANEFARIEQDLFEAEWAAAKEALGRDPKVGELANTPAQRRADALVEMAVRSKGANATDRRAEPLFSVLVGYEALHGRISRIEGGPIVSPGALLPWLKGADFERIVFSPRARIECSTTARFFTGATRRAIEVRDQCCTHPFCEAPAERCQIDHVIPYAKGGETTQENGRVHCGFHNRLRNQGGDDGGDDECGGDGTGGGGERAGGGDERAGGGGHEADDGPDDEGGP
jgi:hypothetical protein